MTKLTPIELNTDRLILRQWKLSDLPVFAKINSCNKVMQYFPNVLTKDESDSIANMLTDEISKQGCGVWALEEKQSKCFIGFTGLKKIPDYLSFAPAIEICWRLSSQFWHKGYASEAANTALGYAFNHLKLAEIVSFTAAINKPSEKVMQRIGMHTNGLVFNHPMLNVNSPLCQHIVYKISSEQYKTDIKI